MGQGGGDGGIERLDLGVQGAEQLETAVASRRGIGRQRERLPLRQPGTERRRDKGPGGQNGRYRRQRDRPGSGVMTRAPRSSP